MDGNSAGSVMRRVAAAGLVVVVAVQLSCGLLALLSLFVIGIVTFVVTKVLLTKFHFLPNLIPVSLFSEPEAHDEAPQRHVDTFRLCLTCGDISCERHDVADSLLLNPWLSLRIDAQTDQALEDLINELIERYVESWFEMLLVHEPERDTKHSRDHKFIQEVKYMIRYAIANLLLRFSSIDVVDFVQNDLIKVAMNHIVAYQIGKRSSKSAQFIEEAVLEEFERDNLLHGAVTSREQELVHLQKLSELLLPHLLPPKYVNCSHARILIREILSSLILLPVIDALSDPSVLNKLLVDSLCDATGEDSRSDHLTPKKVEILSGFSVSSQCTRAEHSVTDDRDDKMMFGIKLKHVADDAQLLFLFMQFLKEEGAVNLIQFYLAFETLTNKLMNPDPSEDAAEDLVSEVRTLYRSFIDPESIDCIKFSDPNVVSDVRNILAACEESNMCVGKMRTCESLYTASFEVNLMLERYYLDVFFETSFYLKMVSGPRWSPFEAAAYSLLAPDAISPKFHPKHRRQASMTSLKRAVKESFWPSPDEGLIPPSASFNSFSGLRSSSLCGMDQIEHGVDLLEGFDRTSLHNLVERFASDGRSVGCQTRGFTSMMDWNISVPEIATRLDSSLKYFHVFVIDVTDTKKNSTNCKEASEDANKQISWRVERRYQEFYALESKLREFHGESLLAYPGFHSLPSRNWSFISTPKETIHFLETKKEEMGKFLASLVTCEKLRGSQLVFNFLNDSAEFIPSSITDSLNIRKIMKNVPAKLTSEKGQNLDPFVATLVESALAQAKDGGNDSDSGCMTPPDEQPTIVVPDPRNVKSESFDCERAEDRHVGAFDFLLFLLVRVLGFSTTSALTTAVVALESVVRNSLDTLLAVGIGKLMFRICEPQSVTKMLREGKAVLLRSLQETDGRSARDQRRNNEKKALEGIRDLVQGVLPVLLPEEKVEEAAFLFYSVIQHRNLNKQLLYLSLDILVTRLFPQIVIDN